MVVFLFFWVKQSIWQQGSLSALLFWFWCPFEEHPGKTARSSLTPLPLAATRNPCNNSLNHMRKSHSC